MTIHRNIVKSWRDSAALLLVSRLNNHGKFKILMLKRTPKSSFMPSSYVFPGGVTTRSDFAAEWKDLLKIEVSRFNNRLQKNNLSDCKNKELYLYTSNAEKPLDAQLAFRLCSLRETFEESGILLVRDEAGGEHALTDANKIIGGEYSTLGKWREKVNEDPDSFLKLFMEVDNLRPNVSSLYEWSCALTPTFMKRRFDTIFHMCFLQHLPSSIEDNAEVVASVWETPQQLLETHANLLPPPQQFELQRLATYHTFEELQTFAISREKHGLQLACPYLVKLKDGNLKTYPGDDLHNDDPNAKFVDEDMTVAEAYQRSVHLHRAEDLHGGDVSRIRCNIEWCGHPPLGDVSTKRWSA